jgi:hypothetical protein
MWRFSITFYYVQILQNGMDYLRNRHFWFGLFIFMITIFLSLAIYLHWVNVDFRVGPYYVTHWFSWVGVLFIALFTPIYYVVKRRKPQLLSTLILFHTYGNLLSFLFISTHFASQLGRPAAFYPDLGTGIALYLVMLILVLTGFLHRFQIMGRLVPHQNRFLHISVTTAFYVVIFVHILEGLRII